MVLDSKHKKKAESIIPEYYGILTFRNDKLVQSRKALLNKNIQSIVQLNLLSKRELNRGFLNQNKKEILESYGPKRVNKIFKELNTLSEGGNLLYQLPTGGGKTVVFSEITRRYIETTKKKVVVLTHRIELSHQTSKMLHGFGVSNKIINS